MVRRIALVAAALLAVLLVACGGDGGSSAASSSAEPDQTPERTSTGPTARVEPRSGPPGSEITVSGASWPPGVLVDVTGQLPPGVRAEPYATATTDQSGTFSVSFRLETTPDGNDLEVGRYNLIVRSASNAVDVPFLVETRRPIQNQGPGG